MLDILCHGSLYDRPEYMKKETEKRTQKDFFISDIYHTEKNLFLFLFSALVWGSSVKHAPQKVGKDHLLNDEDVVQIVKK